jgi:hypothetical protein
MVYNHTLNSHNSPGSEERADEMNYLSEFSRPLNLVQHTIRPASFLHGLDKQLRQL